MPASDFRQFPIVASVDILAWLSKYDATPKIAPQWPESKFLTLVFVFRETQESPVMAYVLVSEQQLDQAFNLEKLTDRWLFFTVPRSAVLVDSIRPQGLEPTSWE